jgi:hypothetical protein
MKTIAQVLTVRSHSILSPLQPAQLPLFFALAFLPSLLRLAAFAVPVTNPLAALGPIAAGFWFAASVREIRYPLALLGPVVSALLWSVNWLMMAGGVCCQTMN